MGERESKRESDRTAENCHQQIMSSENHKRLAQQYHNQKRR